MKILTRNLQTGESLEDVSRIWGSILQEDSVWVLIGLHWLVVGYNGDLSFGFL